MIAAGQRSLPCGSLLQSKKTNVQAETVYTMVLRR